MSLKKKKREMLISSRFCPNFSLRKFEKLLSFSVNTKTPILLSQKTSSSVVYIEDIELPKTSSGDFTDEENATIEGTGSGFVWDKLGHIVSKNPSFCVN